MGAEGEERAGNNIPICTWQLFGAGLLTPPSAGRQVSRRGRGWRPPVGEVARSGDLATTWFGIATKPGSCSRPVPEARNTTICVAGSGPTSFLEQDAGLDEQFGAHRFREMLIAVADQRDGPPRQRGTVLAEAPAEQGLDLVQEHVLRVVERVDRDFPEPDRSGRRLEVAPGEEPLVVHVLVHRVA